MKKTITITKNMLFEDVKDDFTQKYHPSHPSAPFKSKVNLPDSTFPNRVMTPDSPSGKITRSGGITPKDIGGFQIPNTNTKPMSSRLTTPPDQKSKSYDRLSSISTKSTFSGDSGSKISTIGSKKPTSKLTNISTKQLPSKIDTTGPGHIGSSRPSSSGSSFGMSNISNKKPFRSIPSKQPSMSSAPDKMNRMSNVSNKKPFDEPHNIEISRPTSQPSPPEPETQDNNLNNQSRETEPFVSPREIHVRVDTLKGLIKNTLQLAKDKGDSVAIDWLFDKI